MAENQPMLWACEECGCTDVEGTAWVKLNGEEFADGDPPTDQVWCPNCEIDYARLVQVPAAPVTPGSEATGVQTGSD